MKKNIKKLWLAALRSGKYKQGKYHLKCDGKYCCLGVLCDLHSKATKKRWGKPAVPNDSSDGALESAYFKQGAYLPVEVVNWAGVGAKNPAVGGYSLSYYNDSVSLDFETIADLIEDNL